MRILFVAMAESIHTARWISQISEQKWDKHVFPSNDCGIVHPDLKDVHVYNSLYGRSPENVNIKLHGIPIISNITALLGREVLKRVVPKYRIAQLVRLIKIVQPDIIHSMETQAAGYLTLEAKKKIEGPFPTWVHTVWGSDLFLFGQMKEHQGKIKEMLPACDYFLCECQRDITLARSFGFKGEVFPVMPATGSFDLEKCSRLKQPGDVSARRIIILKGYHGWAGRALVGLQALERCADRLKGYEIVITVASPEVSTASKMFTSMTGIPTKIIRRIPYDEILDYYGKARLAIGLSISDGLPSSFLEAMVMGSFPIQSWTSCADEWIQDGKTGMLVPPEDPEIVAEAIRSALTDDDLVNRAAELNWKTAVNRLDQSILKPKVVQIYTDVAKERGIV